MADQAVLKYLSIDTTFDPCYLSLDSTFKVKCLINWYRLISGCGLRTLKEICMAKSTQDLDVNIDLSICGFIGVVAFEST